MRSLNRGRQAPASSGVKVPESLSNVSVVPESPRGSPPGSPPASSASGSSSSSVSALSDLSGASALAQWDEHVGEVLDEATSGDDRLERTRRFYKILDRYVKVKIGRCTKRLHDGFTKAVDAKAKVIAYKKVVKMKDQCLEAVKSDIALSSVRLEKLEKLAVVLEEEED